MPASVKVDVALSVDADDLRTALEERGLSVRAIEGGDGPLELEVTYSTGEIERLASDVRAALEAWVSERELPLVPTPLDAGNVWLRPPAD